MSNAIPPPFKNGGFLSASPMKEQRASTRKTMKFLNDLSKVSNVEIDCLLKDDEGDVIGCVLKFRDITLDGSDKL